MPPYLLCPNCHEQNDLDADECPCGFDFCDDRPDGWDD